MFALVLLGVAVVPGVALGFMLRYVTQHNLLSFGRKVQ